jgi:tetratricopeptide (TPR) repeat protein
MVLDGAAKVHKERGNLPKARQVLDEALKFAIESGDAFALGATYQDLGAVAGMAGCHEEAIRMCWLAVQHYESQDDRLGALTSLAAVLAEAGQLDAAESAFVVVARHLKPSLYRLYALAGYARMAGLKGDRREFERRIAVLEAEGSSEGPAAFRTGHWVDRGDVYRGLGDLATARSCYERALELAEAHRLGQFLVQAEKALRGLDGLQADVARTTKPPADASPKEIEDIREELDRMRQMSPALAGVS